MEYKLFEGDIPHVSTAAFHADRERAAHLEQPIHRDRLMRARDFVVMVANDHVNSTEVTVSDLGCGDGGLLSLLKEVPRVTAWGYDFQPSSRQGWLERRIDASALDVFGKDRNRIIFGDVTVCTEVLEHIADPHDAVKWIGEHSSYLVASSPWTEDNLSHDECHAWAWDMEGYAAMIKEAGFNIHRHEKVGMFQVMLAEAQ